MKDGIVKVVLGRGVRVQRGSERSLACRYELQEYVRALEEPLELVNAAREPGGRKIDAMGRAGICPSRFNTTQKP